MYGYTQYYLLGYSAVKSGRFYEKIIMFMVITARNSNKTRGYSVLQRNTVNIDKSKRKMKTYFYVKNFNEYVLFVYTNFVILKMKIQVSCLQITQMGKFLHSFDHWLLHSLFLLLFIFLINSVSLPLLTSFLLSFLIPISVFLRRFLYLLHWAVDTASWIRSRPGDISICPPCLYSVRLSVQDRVCYRLPHLGGGLILRNIHKEELRMRKTVHSLGR